MRLSFRSTVLFATLLGGGALVSSNAGAQGFQKAPIKAPVVQGTLTAAPVPPPPPPITQSVVNVMTDRMAGQANVATSAPLDGVPVMNGFHFRFSNGDHEFQRMGVATATPASATMFFRDHNADDPFKAEAAWINVKGAGVVGQQVFGKGEGQFEIPLPTARPAGHRLVLSGFGITNFNDEDVQMMGIWLDEAKNVARVSLYREAPGGAAAALGMAGSGRLGGVFQGTTNGLGCNQNSTATQYKPVGFHIQYAYLPPALVAGDDYFTGTTRAPASGKVMGPRAALQGFEFLFTSKRHHLREIGVMPPLEGAATRTASRIGGPNEFIAFQDTNRDDPIQWAVKLVNLKP